MLYGIGAFSGPPLSNNSPFPAPSGYGGGRWCTVSEVC